MNGEPLAEETARGKRPLGVWLLTIYLALFAGIAPLLLLTFLLAAETPTTEASIPAGPALVVPAFTGLGVLVSSIAAWRGRNWGRYALVAFSALHYGLVAANNLGMLWNDTLPDVPSLQPVRLWGRVIRGPIYIAIVAWYFLASKGAKEFYRHGGQSA